jgi:cytoskeleton protein RodZ
MRDQTTLPATLGGALRERRLARGMSLADMARATRIGQSYLDALEGDRLAELPAPVFVRGFIRAYCEQLDEPPGEHLQRYRHVLGESADAEPRPSVPVRRGPQLGPMSISLILAAILGAGLVLLTQLGRTPREPGEPIARAMPGPVGETGGGVAQPATSPPAVPAPATAPLSAPPTAPPTAGPAPRDEGRPSPRAPEGPREPASGPALSPAVSPALQAPELPPLKLTVRAVEQTWLRVQTDDGRVASELLEAGTVREWTSDTRFVLTVGNAAGIELTLNGRPMPPLGGRGVVRRLEIPGPGAAEASTSR